MKSSTKKVCLFGLSLLGGLGIVSFINITSGAGVVIDPSLLESQHTTLLHSLYLWKGDSTDNTGVRLKVSPGGEFLDILNGFVVSEKKADGTLGVIGGGSDNELNGQNAGVGGGNKNIVLKNSVVGGGFHNVIEGENSVIVGGWENKASNGGVVVGGEMGESQGGVVLGGMLNMVGKNSMVFGRVGGEGSFVWNGMVGDNVAYIGAAKGLLIGTNVKKDGVSLVVSGAVKIGDSSIGVGGEIISSNDGCFKANDGKGYQGLGRSSGAGACGSDGSCLFGGVYIQNGDYVKGYKDYYVYGDCGGGVTIQCVNGELTKKGYYPYCHTISSNDSLYEG